MIFNKNLLFVLLLFIFAGFIVACANESTNNDLHNDSVNSDPNNEQMEEDDDSTKDPITIVAGVNFDEERFIDEYKTPLEEKYDHITFEYMNVPSSCAPEFQEVIVSENIPDVFY